MNESVISHLAVAVVILAPVLSGLWIVHRAVVATHTEIAQLQTKVAPLWDWWNNGKGEYEQWRADFKAWKESLKP